MDQALGTRYGHAVVPPSCLNEDSDDTRQKQRNDQDQRFQASRPARRREESRRQRRPSIQPKKILSVDIGGSKVKILASGETRAAQDPVRAELTPARMVERVRKTRQRLGLRPAVSIGYPGLVGATARAPSRATWGRAGSASTSPRRSSSRCKIVNDAAMQALGSYEGGRMLFLGLGTGLGRR